MIDEVVDLPLVPVTQTTRSRSASWQPEAEPADQHDPGLAESGRLGPVGADAGGFHDDLAAGQGVKAAVGGREDARLARVVVD